jgi:hypothetical protein
MTVPVLADRVMKARRESTCPACGGIVRPGSQIARCPGRLWFHIACYIADGGHRHAIDQPDKCSTEGKRS